MDLKDALDDTEFLLKLILLHETPEESRTAIEEKLNLKFTKEGKDKFYSPPTKDRLMYLYYRSLVVPKK